MPSDAQRKATKKYDEKTYAKFHVRINKEKYTDLLNWLESKDSKNGTIIKALEELKKSEKQKVELEIVSKAQSKATAKYIKKTYTVFRVNFRNDTYAEIIKKLKEKENITQYLKNLINKDLR